MSSPFSGRSLIFRIGKGCHRYLLRVNGKIRILSTPEKDFDAQLTSLFGILNACFGFSANFAQKVAASVLLVSLLGTTPALALPTGGESVAGNVQITHPNSATMDVTTAANHSIVNWQTFNIGQGETVNFILPSSASSILNRVVGGTPSQIFGAMNSNGHVFLVNPSGIIFGPTAQVNVGSLFASTLNMTNQNFLNGNYVFTQDPNTAPGSVVNQGGINVAKGGYAALVGSHVENAGSITASEGTIALVAGNQVTLNVADGLGVKLTVDKALTQRIQEYQDAVKNAGTLKADGGLVQLQAKLEGELYSHAVNNTGRVQAQSVALKDGAVEFTASGGYALVENSGAIDASGTAANANAGKVDLEGDTVRNSGTIQTMGVSGGQGGAVSLLGDKVLALAGSNIDASGDTGGGTVLVGGDYQGKNPLIRNASFNYTDPDTLILANAGTHGNGGKVILWSDDKTVFQGRIEAKGGAQGGDGGFVETSGHNILQATGSVDAGTVQGKSGQWLLDPNNITIQTGGSDTNLSCTGGTCSTTDDSAIVTDATINAALNSGTNVTIQTSNGGANSQAGDINISAGTTISKTSGGDATLTLKANNSILSNGTSGSHVTFNSSSGKLNLVLNADTDQGFDSGAGGAIKLNYTELTSNGGAITLGGGTNPLTTATFGTTANKVGISLTGSTLTSGAGVISIRGRGRTMSSGGLYGINLDTASQIRSTSGSVTLTGMGGTGNGSNYGVYLNGANNLITSVDGNVSVTGQGGNNGAGNYGVYLLNGGQITSTGAATLNINGTGGTSNTNPGTGYGVYLTGTNSRITSLNGDVSITGQGGNHGDTNYGIALQSGGQITSTGAATLTINGTGGNTGNNNHGVYLKGLVDTTTTYIRSQTGDITVTGMGGNNTTSSAGSNNGVLVDSNAQIYSTGTAKVTVSGTGGNGTSTSNSNFGVRINNGSISSVDGDVSIAGHGGNAGANNYWIQLNSGGQVISTGAATINIDGTGGNGTSSNYGVYVTGSTATYIQSQTGDITVTGTGGNGSSSTNTGVNVNSGGRILSTGTATVTVSGTGGTGSGSDYGVLVTGTNSRITSLNGDVSITGHGGTGGAGNYGLYLLTGGQISSTGAATLNLHGTGGTGTGTEYGVYLTGTNSLITSATGDVSLTGHGGSGGMSNYGVYLFNRGQITSTGAATLNINGTAGNGTSNNIGVILDGNTGNATYIRSQTGDITVAGTGGNGDGSSTDNYGVAVINAGQINSTGTANISLTGTGNTSASNSSDILFLGSSSVLGDNAMTGNILLNANSTQFSGLHMQTSGNLTLKPRTPSLSIGINGGVGSLQISNAGLLDLIDTSVVHPAKVILGNPNRTGIVMIGDNWNISTYDFPIEVVGGHIDKGTIISGSTPLTLLTSEPARVTEPIVPQASKLPSILFMVNSPNNAQSSTNTVVQPPSVIQINNETVSSGVNMNMPDNVGPVPSGSAINQIIQHSDGTVEFRSNPVQTQEHFDGDTTAGIAEPSPR